MASYGYTFNSGDSVTPERLNNARTITDIVNADISASAEIAVSKLADGTARQLLQTDAAGTGVEWTDNVDVPGTLDVTGAATLDSTLAVTGAATFAPGVVVTGTSSDNAVRITQLGTGNALVVEDSANPDSTPVVIDASGNTVIGHTAAVSIGGTTQPLTVNGLGASIVRAAADAFGAVLNFCKSRSTTIGGARALTQDGDELGVINFVGDDAADLGSIAASISAEADGLTGSNAMPGRLIFSTTADGSDTPTERMRINAAGNVGIGTSSPSYRLHSSGSGFNGGKIGVESTDAATSIDIKGVNGAAVNDSAFITFRDGTNARNAFIGLTGDNATAGALRFATGNNNERMRLTTGGEVGIGTTTPSGKAILDLSSTTKGFLPPRMTTAQRDAISTPPAGLVIYNTTTNVLNFYNGSAWGAV